MLGDVSLHDKFTEEATKLIPGQPGLLVLDWNKGNRTVLVDPSLTGRLLGQTLYSMQAELYRALIEATAFGARVIVDRIKEYGVPVERIVCSGGIAEKNRFYDICFFPKGACWSPESRQFREKHELLDKSLAVHDHFMAKAHEMCSKRYLDVVHAAQPEATIFYNAVTDTFLEPGLGGRARYKHMSHMEIESLPSGFWGYYQGSLSFVQVGIATNGPPGIDSDETAKSDEGAIQMCEEAHYKCGLLDGGDTLDGLELVILTGSATLTEDFVEKLRTVYQGGGKLLISHKGGCDASGQWALDFLPVKIHGDVAEYPTYWRPRTSFSPALARTDRVFYGQELVISTAVGKTLVERVLPYFKRGDVRYCSHLQTPPRPEASGQAAVMAGERFVIFAEPIFRDYRQAGNIAARDAWKLAMQRLIGPAPFGHDLASTIQIYPRRRGEDLILSLLHSIPVRKALNINMIEGRSSFAGKVLRLPSATSLRVFGSEELARDADGGLALPAAAPGRLLLESPEFFKT